MRCRHGVIGITQKTSVKLRVRGDIDGICRLTEVNIIVLIAIPAHNSKVDKPFRAFLYH